MPAPKKKSPPALIVPTTKIVLCGPHTIYWLPADAKMSPEVLQKKITPEEFALAKKIKAKDRHLEFIRARWLYHSVTKQTAPLVRTPQGYPKWPETVLGSISHKDGHVMFAKVSPETHHSIGMDVEKLSKIKLNIESKICSAEESALLDQILQDPFQIRLNLLAIIFSVKESVFKSHYPLGKKHFGFTDVSVLGFDFERKEVKARLNVKTSNETPKDHLITAYFNWINYDTDKFVVTTVEERKPIVLEPVLVIDEDEAETKPKAVPDVNEELDLAVDA